MVIRVICGLLALLLVLFAGVQYNDPDFLFWGAIYGAAGAWCAVACAMPGWLKPRASQACLGICVAMSLLATVHFWPTEAAFWRRDVWWESEPAREGMGMMIVFVCLLFPMLAAVRQSK